MTDKTVTEREAVLRERKAFFAGAEHQYYELGRALDRDRDLNAGKRTLINSITPYRVKEEAQQRYPLPKVSRSRVVRDPEYDRQQWTVTAGQLHFRIDKDSEWLPYLGNHRRSGFTCGTGYAATLERVRVWADLLERPTEEVEEDGR